MRVEEQSEGFLYPLGPKLTEAGGFQIDLFFLLYVSGVIAFAL